MGALSRFFRMVVRLLVVWFVDALSLLLTAWILPGINISPVNDLPAFVVATAAALVLGIANLLIRPLLLLVAMPLGWLVIFAVGFFVNAAMLRLTGSLMPGFEVTSWWWAFVGGIFLSFVNLILTELINVNTEYSYYTNLVLRQAAKEAEKSPNEGTRGLVMVEIDGLSYHHIQKALQDGYMPTIQKLMDEAGYRLSLVDCGLPATTPACQAGILQGNNDGIPAFRWLDKSTGKMLAGGGAAAVIEPDLSNGDGLLSDGGSSISNMFSGDADKSILTFSKIKAGTPEDKKKRARDMYLLMRDPNFMMRTLVLFFGDVIQEVWQYWQQRRQDVQPRLNRLHNGYPFLRAATNVFLRDIGAFLTVLDIVRGVPAIYVLWAGYDEVAHHSGPWTSDAMKTLRQFDRTIALILRAIEEQAPRPYEFILLSDHGQSFGATFEQRYEIPILEFIKQQLPEGVQVVATGGGDDGSTPVAAMMQELENMEEQGMTGGLGKAVVDRTKRTLGSNPDLQARTQEVQPTNVTLCYSGNLAQVYFDLQPRKLSLSELNAAYPGMVDALVQHEGLGFVVAYQDDWDAVAFGKNGARNLHNGDVVGEDPLAPFGDVELRAWQLKRIADFSNAGDLILNSALYPDGSVAALEELIGCHGGLGGEQTDAFILHPGDMEVPETRNSYEVYRILKNRRGLPGPTPLPERPPEPQVNAWSLGVLGAGLGRVGQWLNNAMLAIVLSRDAYRTIARDAYMTGPALLLALLGQVFQEVNDPEGFDLVRAVLRTVLWLAAVALLHGTAVLLRGKGTYTSTLRVAGFAQSAHVLQLLGFIPVIGPLAQFMGSVLALLGVWLGVTIAHQLKGWRTLLLPVVFILTTVVALVFLGSIIEGSAFALDGVLESLGLVGE